MYRQILVPTETAHSIDLPKELYGLKVEVIAFSIKDEPLPFIEPKVDPHKFYNAIKLDFSNFKFDRIEANER